MQWITDAPNMFQEAVASLPKGHLEEGGVAVNQVLTSQFASMHLIYSDHQMACSKHPFAVQGVLLLEHFGIKYPIIFRSDNRDYCPPSRLFLGPENRAALGSVDEEGLKILPEFPSSGSPPHAKLPLPVPCTLHNLDPSSQQSGDGE